MLHGKTPTTYAAQVMTEWIEANFDTINKQLEDFAKSQGKTVDEILAALDRESNR